MSRTIAPRVDLAVVGGGPVGLAVATRAARSGLDVVVLEPRHGPIDKACGEGLMPGAVAELGRLGVQPPGRPFRGVRYVDGDRAADARFGDGAGLGVRRTVLHAALLQVALDSGATVLPRRVGDLRQHAEHVELGGVRARWVVAADGLHSPVRRLLGLQAAPVARRRWGVVRHLRVAPWSDLVEVHWSGRTEAYVTPLADDLVGVAVLGPRGTDVDAALAATPSLARRLAGADPVGRDRGAGPLRQSCRSPAAGRVLLAGDASGFVDALTGEGLRTGLAQARAAVDAVLHDDADRYAAAWRRVTWRSRLLTSALLGVAGSDVTRRAVVPVAAAVPGLMRGCVGVLAR